jgi:hypothetical protein
MVVIPEQQMHLKQFMEGKSSVVANLSEEVDEEDSSVNKVGVHNFRYPVKNPPFYISVKIMDKIPIVASLMVVQAQVSCRRLLWKS